MKAELYWIRQENIEFEKSKVNNAIFVPTMRGHTRPPKKLLKNRYLAIRKIIVQPPPPGAGRNAI